MILKRIEEEKQKAFNFLLSSPRAGGPADFAAYRYYVGIISGLEAATQIIKDTNEQIDDLN